MKKFLTIFLLMFFFSCNVQAANISLTIDGIPYACTPSSVPQPTESISTPIFVGPSTGKVGQANTYTITTPAISSLGDPVQYFYNWGNVNTGWVNSLSYQKAWAFAGTYQVMVQARCAIHPNVKSTWSAPLTVTISPVVVSGLGTKTNPIPMTKDAGWGGYYYPSNGGGVVGSGVVPPLGANKVWFVVDTLFCKTQPVKKFDWQFKGYNNTTLVYSKIVQDKAGNDLTPETPVPNSIGDGYDFQVTDGKPYSFSATRWLYAIENPARDTEVWVIFYVH